MGSGAGNFLKVLLKNFDVLAGPVISLVYPLYASIRAIESKSPIDDQQWLTYWVLYSLITLFELTFARVLEWIPIWPYAKLIATCWLVLPYFSGAAYVYEHYVRPFYVNPQTINIWLTNQERVAVIIQCMMRLIEYNHVVSLSFVDKWMHVHVTMLLIFYFSFSVVIFYSFFFIPLLSFYIPVTSFGLVIYVLYNGYDTHVQQQKLVDFFLVILYPPTKPHHCWIF
uniref:HVA22-like protein n=1 Tax=Glycine max TaxID=3847 RepID=A0A0R0FJJ2_SOYBN